MGRPCIRFIEGWMPLCCPISDNDSFRDRQTPITSVSHAPVPFFPGVPRRLPPRDGGKGEHSDRCQGIRRCFGDGDGNGGQHEWDIGSRAPLELKDAELVKFDDRIFLVICDMEIPGRVERNSIRSFHIRRNRKLRQIVAGRIEHADFAAVVVRHVEIAGPAECDRGIFVDIRVAERADQGPCGDVEFLDVIAAVI